MKRRSFLCLFLAVGMTAAGCASTGESGTVRRDSSVLTREELADAPSSNLYEAVDRLRPRWLEMRTTRSLSGGPGQIVVFLNRSYLGGPEALRQFQTSDVVRVRYLDSAQASAQLTGYPTQAHVHAGIVIEIAEQR